MASHAEIITLSVPAQAAYARAVRMTAASLAVMCNMSVDAVEDVRMAAGEGFVYACATAPMSCDIAFELTESALTMKFNLGSVDLQDSNTSDLNLIELVLDAVCDDFGISDEGDVLLLTKRTDAAYVE